MKRLSQRLLACQRGAAAVEFAIVSVVLITLSVGIVDFGRTLYVKNQLARLADEASRQLLLDSSISSASLETDIEAGFTAGDVAHLTVSITQEAGTVRDFRVITIDYPITLFVPGLSSDTIDLSVSRRIPID